jgi:quercetin dioxygenase-like cupin family protein
MATKGKSISNPKTGQSIRFIQTSRDTDGRLLEMEAIYQPNSKEPVAHYHPAQSENFKVIKGELTVKINNNKHILKEGDTLQIPEKLVHSMWNESNGTTVVNWQVRPAMDTENLLETFAGLAIENKTDENGVPNILQVALTVNKYAPVFRMANPPFIIQKILFGILIPFAYLFSYRPVYKKYID